MLALNSAVARPTSSAGARWVTSNQKAKLPSETTSVAASSQAEPPSM